ncbi:MAG TPA: CCA tRNA nucleotidyltransferase [Acidobacteriaceae bacterium]|jgi:tRNA nucleotidyltransferase/poly(A) polymerase
MADYIYLLQTRLTGAQQAALEKVRDIAKSHNMTVFLAGGAVRDLTSGAPIRDLDVAVQGSALTLRKDLESAGGIVIGESRQMEALFLNFPGGVRMEVGSTLSVTFPKPGKPVVEHANILDDLRRRDFTANAMALSLNEGSFGLLMDPLNGVADIENMELRLVSNYGFIEDPVRMIRAARLSARLGWHLEERTQQRYENGKAEGYIAAMSPWQQGYETEEIFHEEDPLRVLRRLEAEGWSQNLFPAWTSAKVNENELNKLRDLVGQLDIAGIHPDPSPAYFPILTAKLAPKDLEALTHSFVRPGFVKQVEALEGQTKAFATQFTSKAAAAPSDAWKLLHSAPPEQVLSLAYTSKSAPVQARFKAFFTEWPQARNRIPYQLMQEMRITPDLPGYAQLVEDLFFALMDGKLDTPEAARAYLEPFSPPAPPPPVNLRRRAVKREGKATKSRKKDAAPKPVEGDEAADGAEEAAPAEAPVKAPKAPKEPKAKPEAKPAPAAVKAPPAAKKVVAPAKAEAKKPALTAKVAAKKPAAKPVAKKAAKQVKAAKKAVAKPAAKKAVKAPAKKAAVKPVAKKAASKKPAPKKAVKAAKKVVAKGKAKR